MDPWKTLGRPQCSSINTALLPIRDASRLLGAPGRWEILAAVLLAVSAAVAGAQVGCLRNSIPNVNGRVTIPIDCNACDFRLDLCFDGHGCCGNGFGHGGVTWTLAGAGADASDTLGLRLDGPPGVSGFGCVVLRKASDLTPLRPGAVLVTVSDGTSPTPCTDSLIIELTGSACCGTGLPGGTVACPEPPPSRIRPPFSRKPGGGEFVLEGGYSKGDAPLAGAISLRPGLVSATLPLGAEALGADAGAMHIQEAEPCAGFGTPHCLKYAGTNANNEVLTNTSGLRQIRSSDVLVDVEVVNAYRFRLKYYPTNLITGKSGGYYTMSGSPHYQKWFPENIKR